MSIPVTLLRYISCLTPMLLAAATMFSQTTSSSRPASNDARPEMRQLAQASSVKFTENRGQIIDTDGKLRPDILYKGGSKGVDLYFTRGGIQYIFTRIEGDIGAYEESGCAAAGHQHAQGDADAHNCKNQPAPIIHQYRMDMELIGANPNARVDAENVSEDYINYYLAHCPQGITNVPSYRKLTYREIYPNIDLVVYAIDNGAKYDFVVRPGGNAANIKMKYVAADRVELTNSGGLHVANELGFIEEQAPFSYQGTPGSGSQQEIKTRYRLVDDVITFVVGSYNPRKTLVIDPEQIWATFYGGNTTDNLNGGDPSEVDRSGNVLIAGFTSANFPTVSKPGGYSQAYNLGSGFPTDAFVVKFTGRGRLEWATYYGGSGAEIAHCVATDSDGNVFISGHTESTNFPVQNAQQDTNGRYAVTDDFRDAFVVKFNPDGLRRWATYCGGRGWDDGYGFAVDSNRNVAVLVTSGSSGRETSGKRPNAGGRDPFVVKYNENGVMQWATYFGGANTDYGYAAASDIHDNIIITGWVFTGGFPTLNPSQGTYGSGATDGFVAMLSSSGERKWATYIGGSGGENESGSLGLSGVGYCGVATDGRETIYITGATSSTQFPITTGAFSGNLPGTDAFIVKYDTSGAKQWATYFGGSGTDVGVGAASNTLSGVLITGFTTSGDLPTVFPGAQRAFQAGYGANTDAFIAKLDKDGKGEWVTYFGGSLSDEGQGISFDPFGAIIIGGHTSSTSTVPFVKPRSPSEPAAQGFNALNTDAFVSVFCDPIPPQVDSSGPLTFCYNQDVTLSIVDGYFNVKWYKMDGATKVQISTALSITVAETGRFFVEVENAGGCPARSDTIKVTKLDPLNPMIPPEPNAFCAGDSINITVAGGPYAKYTWKRNDVEIAGATTATLKVKQGGLYKVIVENIWGCKDSVQHTVTEHALPSPISVTPTDTLEFCEGEIGPQLVATGGSGGVIQWSNGAGSSVLNVTQQGLYFAKSVNGTTGCFSISNKVFVRVNPKPIISIIPLLPLEFCEGDSTVLVASRTEYRKYSWSTGEEGQRIVVKKSGTVVLSVMDDKGCKNQAQVTVTMHERQFPKITPSGPIVRCDGDTVLLALQGGTFTTVLWSNGVIGVPARITKSGSYWASTIGPGGCRAYSDTIQVTFTPSPDARISGPKAVCRNSSASYSVPDQPGVTYQWTVTGTGASISSGAGTSSIGVNWGPAGAGEVRVVVTHTATTCKSTGTLAVDVGSVLVPTIIATPGPNICPGDSTVLDAGPNYATYKWSNGATTRTITVKAGGTYTVTVSNAGGCEGSSLPLEVKVTQPPAPSIVLSRSPVLCPGDTVYLSVAGTFSEYSWSGGQSIDRIAVWEAGTHTVTVTDANGCSGTSAPVEVTMAVPPAPVIRGPGSVCISSTETYSVTPVNGDSYAWNVTGGQINGAANGTSITVTWPAAGPGLVEIRQTSGTTGCSGLAQYNVKVSTTLEPEITADGSTLICQGDSVRLSATEGYASYLWSDGSSGRETVVKGPGLYSVTVTNSGGCSGTGVITITEKPPLAPKVVPDGRPGLCLGDSLRLEATPGFQRYLWSTGATTPFIWVKQAGEYAVTVFDADSCSDVSAAVQVTFFPQLATPFIYAVGDTLMATIDTVDSPKPMTYQWKIDGQPIAGATLRNHYISIIGSYTVTVYDSNGCSVESAPLTPFVAGSAALGLPDIQAAPGERVKIPLALTASNNLDRNRVEQFSGELRFDKSLLILADPRFTSTIDGDQQVVKITGSRPALMDAGDLLTIDFIAALGNKLTTPLELRSFLWLDGLAGQTPVTIQQGRFTLVNVCETGGLRLLNTSGNVGIKAVRPNPASAVAEIEYEVNEDGATQLFIVDVLGRRVATLVDGQVQPGRYAVQFDAAQLASGMYHCILQTPTVRLHYPLQVEK